MDLFEYQARELLRRYDVPIPAGMVARTPEQAREAAEQIGTSVVVKAQVKTGGRGKAGGVALAESPDEAEAAAQRILGMDIKGHQVGAVLIVEALDISHEYYFSILIDRAERSLIAICSASGGVDIEELAETTPDAVAKVPVDPLTGLDSDTARKILDQAGFDDQTADKLVQVLVNLGKTFANEDASLVEINPLVSCADGSVYAADAKISLDDNAKFRHDDWPSPPEEEAANPLEKQAEQAGLHYVHLDGQVGIIGNGAGLVMSTLDVVADAGSDLPGTPTPANFLDIGGGASAEVMAKALDIVLQDSGVRSVFINVFGGITSCVQVAQGIAQAIESLDELSKPLVVRLDGNQVAEGQKVLTELNNPAITVVDTMDEAARSAAKLASESMSDRQED